MIKWIVRLLFVFMVSFIILNKVDLRHIDLNSFGMGALSVAILYDIAMYVKSKLASRAN